MLSLMSEVAARDEQLRAKDALIEQRERDAAFKQALIDKLTHEVAVLKRMKFAATSEKFAGTCSGATGAAAALAASVSSCRPCRRHPH